MRTPFRVLSIEVPAPEEDTNASPARHGREPDVGPVARREERLDVIRRVEYAPYPRAHRDQAERVGFTRDVSATGMCLRIDDPEPEGSLLRITQSGLDGQPDRESIARVVWSAPTIDGGCWIGLSLLEPRRPLRVNPLGRVIDTPKEIA